MYNVYINHFKRGNSTIDTEELMFAVPVITNAYINKPIVKSSEDSADNFSFSMESNSPYYDAILPYKTTIRVEYDGTIIFWGRALSPSTSTVLHTKTVQCEGSYVYFNNTYYEGVQEKHRTNITVSEYFSRIINNHNNMASDKQIYRGDVGITLPTQQDKYEPTSWTQTSSLLSDLTGSYGGHFRVRYTNGNAYLDWYKYYIRDLGDGNRPSVKIGKNIIDITSEANNSGNLFTRVIPIGTTDKNGKTIYIDGYTYKDKDNVSHTYSGKSMQVSFIRNLYTSAQLTDEFHDWTDYRDAETNYGIIYKTVSFGDADTQEKLFDEVKKWIKDCYFSIASSFTVKAIDLHVLDGSVPKILLGDCVDVTYLITINGTKQWVTKKLVCKAVQYDLFNPENNSYTFGIPSDLLDAAGKHKSSKKTASNDAGSSKRTTPKGSEDEDITWRKIWQMIGTRNGNAQYEGTNAAMSFYNNGQLSGTVKLYDANDIPSGQDPLNHKDKWFDANIVGVITLDARSPKKVCVSSDRGICAYNAGALSAASMYAVAHWYSKKKGYKYEGTEPFVYEEKTGEISATDDQTPEGNKTITFEPTVLTGYGSAGEAKIGYDLTSQTPKWKIKLNYPIQYKDADGVTRIADGFVSAQDFSVQEIPSFKTKIGIFDIVIAGKVEAQTISADLAEVRKWLGDNISVNTWIRTDKLYANKIYSYEDIYLNSSGRNHYQYQLNNATMRNLDDCLYDVQISESNGVITITLPRLNGSAAASDSFNMASTQFYIDAVEAAYERGYEDGGGGGSADNIRLAGWGHRASDPGSSYNNLGTLATEIRTVMASSRGGYVYFYAYINGDTEHKRYYKIDLTA